MRIPLPKPVDLVAEPVLGSLALLEVTLVLTSDALRPGAAPPWADGTLDQDDDDVITARVLAHECLHLRRLLAAYRRRLHQRLRRLRSQLDLPF
jgi:hypothetical protein